MQYEYQVRGKRIQIEQLDGVVAVMPTRRDIDAEQTLKQLGELVHLQERVPAQSDWTAFARAGWVFVQPGPAVLEVLATGTVPEGTQAIQRVFLDANGRLVLGLDGLTVRLAASLSDREALAVLEANGLEVAGRLRFASNLFQVRVTPATRHFLDAAAALAADSNFEYAEPEFMEYMPGRFVPTDPDFPNQWHLANTGQKDPDPPNQAGTVGADIGAEAAWGTSRGAGVKVAIVDNGFDLAQPDLPPVQANSGYFTYNATRTSASYTKGTANYPPGDHGTRCAGLAIARANNGVGGCGVAHLADFIAIACAEDQLDSQSTLARAIAQAADPSCEIAGANPHDGADVISCSLGSPEGQPWSMMTVLRDAICFAVTHGRAGYGALVFWATNDGAISISEDEVCSYPHTIAVGTSNRWDQCGNSAYGPALDFLATGVSVYCTSIHGDWPVSGTSFAAPVAAGVAALMIAACRGLTGQQVRQILRDTCKKIGSGYNNNKHSDIYGYGRIDAAAAVLAAAALNPAAPLAPPTVLTGTVT